MKITEEYIREQILLLYSKDSNTGYVALKELQDASHEDCMVYTHLNEFLLCWKIKILLYVPEGLF